jgi:hypothetical protein
MSAGERAALEAETADLEADAVRRNARAQEAALEAARAEALEASKAAFVKGVEERRNDPARPKTLILNGDDLDRLQEYDPERRAPALLQDDRLRRLPPTTTADDDETQPPNGSRKETFVYDTTLGEARRFEGAASRPWHARWSAAMTRR